MVYIWEFEFFDSDGVVDAVPCGSLGGGGTFGSDLNDAVESAADFLACMVDDHLMGGVDLPAPDFGHGHDRLRHAWAARRYLERRHIYDACYLRLD